MELPLALSSWGVEEYKAIQNVIDNGIFTMGDYVERFENQYAKFVGSRFCVMGNSGSSANLLAVGSLFFTKNNRLEPGDEVIVPAVSWSTSFFPLQQYGLKLIFVDIDIYTLNYDLDALKNAISTNTRLILLVNLLGNPNEYSVIESLIEGKNIRVIEDSCEAMGAEYGDIMAGTFGIMGTFSSFFSHHISTMEGGMVVTDDEELYHILLSLRAHGWTRNLPTINHVTGKKSADPFEESWKFVLPGYNVRPLEMSGAIGLVQLEKLPEFLRVRRNNAMAFHETFSGNPFFMIQSEIGRSSWFGFSLVIRPELNVSRRQFLQLLKKNNIDTRPIVAGNFTRNEVIKYFDYHIPEPLTAADTIHDLGFLIGNHHVDISSSIRKLGKLLSKLP